MFLVNLMIAQMSTRYEYIRENSLRFRSLQLVDFTLEFKDDRGAPSPFNLLEFVTHLKNHSGPIQHDRAEASAGALNYCRQAGRNRTKHCGTGFHGR